MNESSIWLSTGIEHIADINGYDHILFVSLLALAFPLENWTKLLALVTAFTLGHSVSLALSVFELIKAPRLQTELLIALSILVTAVYQLIRQNDLTKQKMQITYLIVCLFGTIHGMGFSYLLSNMLGKEQSVLAPLFYFNLGLEIGQLLIVTAVVLFSLLLTRLFKLPFKTYKQLSLCIIALIALKLCVERSVDYFQS